VGNLTRAVMTAIWSSVMIF